MQLTARVRQIGGKCGIGIWGANVFLLLDNNLTLVDAGFRGRSTQILREVVRLGYSPSDIANIVITHHHADHAGSLASLKRITRAKVIAHPADAPYIDGSLPQPGPARPRWLSKALVPLHRLWATTPATVDTLVSEGDELPMLGGIGILHTPGHTPGSICLFIKQERLLIIGDVLVNRFGLRLPSRFFTVDIVQEVHSIKMLASLDFDIMCFGHGPPLVRNARSTVAGFAEKLERKHESGHKELG